MVLIVEYQSSIRLASEELTEVNLIELSSFTGRPWGQRRDHVGSSYRELRVTFAQGGIHKIARLIVHMVPLTS